MLGKGGRRAEPRELLRDVLDLFAMAVAACLLVLVTMGIAGLPRIFLALVFAFFVPGRAVVTNWRRLSYWSDFGLPIVISLAVLTLAAMIALWARMWHPVGLFEIEAGASLAALAAGLSRRRRHAAGKPDQPAQLLQERDPGPGSAEPVAAEPVAAEPRAAEPRAAEPPAFEFTIDGAAAGPGEQGAADHVGAEVASAGITLDALLGFYDSRGDNSSPGQASNGGPAE